MKPIADLFGNYRLPVRKGIGGGERGALLRYFCEALNPSRVVSGYKPLDEKALIKILPYMNDTRSLFWLKSVCEDAGRNNASSFSKKFWYLQKQQKRIEDLAI